MSNTSATPPDGCSSWNVDVPGIGEALDQNSVPDFLPKFDKIRELKPPLASSYSRLFLHVLRPLISKLGNHRSGDGILPFHHFCEP